MTKGLKKKTGSGSKNLKASGNQGKQSPSIFDKPIFSLQDISNNNDYSFKKSTDSQKLALIERIVLLSNEPWSKIYSQNRHGIGAEKVTIPKSKLPPGTPQDRQYYALRFDISNRAFVGYKCSNNIFHILWIDREYKIYKH